MPLAGRAGISANRTEDEVFLSLKAETAHVLEPELDVSTKRATVQALINRIASLPGNRMTTSA
jgi:hypothetical protein